jgi:16S rRNA methyltransferase gidB
MFNEFKNYLTEGSKILDLEISSQKAEKLFRFYELLIEKNKVMNLTSITDLEEVTYKHFIDSISLIKKVDNLKIENYKIADLGTGAGFPGVPLAIVFPNLNLTLIDSLNKRINFIKDVCMDLKIKNIVAIHARAEDIARDVDYREKFDICVSRAVANLSSLSEYCLPLVKLGGSFISYKSKGADIEILEAGRAIKILGGEIAKSEAFKLEKYGERILVEIKKINTTPKKYPRKAGLPAKEPIK